MDSILSQLPGKDQLSNLIPADFSKFLGLDGISSGINTDDIKNDMGGIAAPENPDMASLAISGAPTKEGLFASLKSPLDDMTNINISSLTGDISSKPLPVDIPSPSFDINSVMGSVTDKIIPANVSVPSIDMDLPGVEMAGFTESLNKLAAAGAGTPMKLLNMLMNIMNSFVDVVKDKNTIIKFTQEAIVEIHLAEVQNLQFSIPWLAVPYANKLLDVSKGNFLVNYEQILTEIENLPDSQFAHIAHIMPILSKSENQVLSNLRDLENITNCLEQLKNNNDQILKDILEKVIDISYSDKVLLQPVIDFITKNADSILGPDGILGPVNQLKDMATKISEFLEQCGKKAEEAATTISTTVEDTVKKIEGLLNTVQAKIEEIEGQIKEFLASIEEKIEPVITNVIDGCNKVGDGVNTVFTKVEEVKQKLDEAVAKIQDKIIDKTDAKGNIIESELTQKLREAETKIRDLLGKISGTFEKPEVKEQLAKVKEGIDTFKTKIEEASFKPVFDLVVTKTDGLENRIQNIDVATMGTPQKTALKVGGKVIEAVKVDEVIKPELLEAFKQIQEPLLELITLLKEKVLIVEQMIYEFQPGTVVEDYIINSEPYKLIISTLEEIKPSELLQPIKEANAELTKLVEKLDPQIIIDEVQKMYNQISELVESLNPASLNKMIADTLNTATAQLEQLKGQGLDNIIETIKKTISLESLMDKTGIKEIADADFWNKISYYLGGKFLDEINKTLQDVQNELGALTATTDFSPNLSLLKEIKDSLISDYQADFTNNITVLISYFDEKKTEIERLEKKRCSLIAAYNESSASNTTNLPAPAFTKSPELKQLLIKMDLSQLTGLKDKSVALNDSQDYKTNIESFYTVLSAKKTELDNIKETALRNIISDIFDKQLSAPVSGLINEIQELLKPYNDALEAVQNILKTLTTLPAKIDASVAKVLDTLRDSIKLTVSEVIETIEKFEKSITEVIQKIYETAVNITGQFSPAYLLNAFSETSFEQEGLAKLCKAIGEPSDNDKTGAALYYVMMTYKPINQTTKQLSEKPDEQTGKQLTEQATDKTTEQDISEQSGDDRHLILKNDPEAQNAGTKKIIVDTLNTALKDNKFAAGYDLVSGQLNNEISKLKAKENDETLAIEQKIENMKSLYRFNSLIVELKEFKERFDKTKALEDLIRLNRLILEAAYSNEIKMSIQSLHPYIVAQISMLYPEK
ncbi:MAG: apolipoprotein A1/A4/E family protein, partial [Desulfobacterales bacterium]|nr:apolipoprotein A1/A4/E family protein [Desulfobacterales bacterium]